MLDDKQNDMDDEEVHNKTPQEGKEPLPNDIEESMMLTDFCMGLFYSKLSPTFWSF